MNILRILFYTLFNKPKYTYVCPHGNYCITLNFHEDCPECKKGDKSED